MSAINSIYNVVVSTEKTPKKGFSKTEAFKMRRGLLECKQSVRGLGYQKKLTLLKTERSNSISEGIQKKKRMTKVPPTGAEYEKAYKKKESSEVYTLMDGITSTAKMVDKLETAFKASYQLKAEYVVLADRLKKKY